MLLRRRDRATPDVAGRAAAAPALRERAPRGRTLPRARIRDSFHPHVGTYIETPREVAALLEAMDTSLLGLCFDTGHWAFGGGDPLASCARPATWSTTSTSRTSTSSAGAPARVGRARDPGPPACSASSAPAGRRSTGACGPARDRLRRLDRGRTGPCSLPASPSSARSNRPSATAPGCGSAACGFRETAARLGRLRGLDTLSDTRGIFALAAMDHRDSLRIAFESAGFPAPPPERIAELKASVARALAPHATGLLIDIELGAPADCEWRPRGVGDGRPARGAGLRGRRGGARVGVDARLLAGTRAHARRRCLQAAAALPARSRASAARQDEVVREAVAGCHAAGLPMILEPIVYAMPEETTEDLRRGLPPRSWWPRRSASSRSARTSSRCSSRGTTAATRPPGASNSTPSAG